MANSNYEPDRLEKVQRLFYEKLAAKQPNHPWVEKRRQEQEKLRDLLERSGNEKT